MLVAAIPRRSVAFALLLGVIALLALAGPVSAKPAGGGAAGAVYVQTNTAPTNYVQILTRNHDGTVTLAGRVATGGAGNPANNPPLGIPFLDSGGSVTLSDDGKLLFAVNAGDSTVTSFRVGPQGLAWADREPTLGVRPISSTYSHHLLYVLNSSGSSDSIVGYKVDPKGKLTMIPGSFHPTSDSANDLSAQIKFDAKGDFLAVSNRATDTIDTFTIGKGGVAGPAVSQASNGESPYGLAFTHKDLLVVANENFSNVFASTASSYDAHHHGELTPVSLQSADSGAACWVEITKNDKFAFVTSPFTGQVVGFPIGKDGSLGAVVHLDNPGTAVLDESLSRDGAFLYVLSSNGFVNDQVLAYRVNKDNSLTSLGASDPFEGSAAGLEAW
jgi:6-phosphogluconolactonase (cycloisomerase 2 family)